MAPGKLSRWLFWGTAALVANSAYLLASGDPVVFYFANVIAHLVLAAVLFVPFVVWAWQRRSRPIVVGANTALLLSAICGALPVVIENTRNNRPWLLAHIALAIVGLVLLLIAFVHSPRERTDVPRGSTARV